MHDLLIGNDARQITVTISSLDRLDDSPGWPERRRALLAEAVRRYPDSWEIVQLRLADDGRAGALTDALALIAPYAAAHWWHAPAHFALGSVYEQLGRKPEAIAAWLNAARLDCQDAEAYSAAAQVYAQENQFADAVHWQSRAVGRQPSSPKQHAVFSDYLSHAGKTAEAAEQLTIANRLLALARQSPHL